MGSGFLCVNTGGFCSFPTNLEPNRVQVISDDINTDFAPNWNRASGDLGLNPTVP